MGTECSAIQSDVAHKQQNVIDRGTNIVCRLTTIAPCYVFIYNFLGSNWVVNI